MPSSKRGGKGRGGKKKETVEEKKPHTQIMPSQWVPLFLEGITQGYTVARAAAYAGVSTTAVYRRRHHRAAFKAAWDRAAEVGTELLEQEAQRRAYHGCDEPVFHKGIQCGMTKRYSDALLVLLLKARKPELYREDKRGTTVHVSIAANQAAVQVLNDVPLDLGVGMLSTGKNLEQGEEELDLSMLDGKTAPVEVESTPAEPLQAPVMQPKRIERRGTDNPSIPQGS